MRNCQVIRLRTYISFSETPCTAPKISTFFEIPSTKWMKNNWWWEQLKGVTCCFKRFCRPHTTKQQLYGHWTPISQTVQWRARYCCWSKDEFISDLWIPTEECSLEDLLETQDDRGGWQEREREREREKLRERERERELAELDIYLSIYLSIYLILTFLEIKQPT